MDILLNPNIAYLILAFGLMVTVLAILSPGTGLLEIGAFFVLVLVAWEVINLGFNWWALTSLIIGIGLFVAAVHWPNRRILLILSIVALVIGSAFLFPTQIWYIPAVNPVLALLVSLLLTGFFWVVTRKVLEARNSPPRLDLNLVIGETGEAKSDIQEEGTVLLGSELWSARSSTLIARGTRVKVTGRQGFILDVVPIDSDKKDEANK